MSPEFPLPDPDADPPEINGYGDIFVVLSGLLILNLTFGRIHRETEATATAQASPQDGAEAKELVVIEPGASPGQWLLQDQQLSTEEARDILREALEGKNATVALAMPADATAVESYERRSTIQDFGLPFVEIQPTATKR